LAYNFNNDPETLTMEPPTPAAGNVSPAPEPSQPSEAPPQSQQQSAAWIKFRSCRWHQPKEEGSSEFCTHREVKPYAGTTGFDAEAWCPDCQYYKLRRAPKKKAPNDDYGY
jgi:hypothetical protein